MKSQPDALQSFSLQGDELPLSGPALAGLLQAVMDKGKPFRFRARGMSMSPFIKDGDLLTIAPLAANAPRIGDVVAFLRQGQRVVVHRIVGEEHGSFTIRGDGLRCADDIVRRESILGAVVRVERNGRTVRLGTGPERRAIALLTGRGVFARRIIPLWLRVRSLLRRPR